MANTTYRQEYFLNQNWYVHHKRHSSYYRHSLYEEIFSFPFNYYSDFKLEDGIILKGEKDYFALIGRKTMCNWLGEHSDELPEEVEEFEDNDLDFEMM